MIDNGFEATIDSKGKISSVGKLKELCEGICKKEYGKDWKKNQKAKDL